MFLSCLFVDRCRLLPGVSANSWCRWQRKPSEAPPNLGCTRPTYWGNKRNLHRSICPAVTAAVCPHLRAVDAPVVVVRNRTAVVYALRPVLQIGILSATGSTYVPRQGDFLMDRIRGVMRKVQGARGVVSLCTLLAVALVLWQGTATTAIASVPAQGPSPVHDDEASAAHLSPDGCSELIINGGFRSDRPALGPGGYGPAADLLDGESVCG